jgi:hypothetical protein
MTFQTSNLPRFVTPSEASEGVTKRPTHPLAHKVSRPSGWGWVLVWPSPLRQLNRGLRSIARVPNCNEQQLGPTRDDEPAGRGGYEPAGLRLGARNTRRRCRRRSRPVRPLACPLHAHSTLHPLSAKFSDPPLFRQRPTPPPRASLTLVAVPCPRTQRGPRRRTRTSSTS